MVVNQERPKRKVSGGRYIKYRKKRQHNMGDLPSNTRVDKKKVKVKRERRGSKKLSLLAIDIVNVYDPKSKKYSKSKIKNIVENAANRHFVRRNILTRGAIVETELGKAKITSRPGQEGTVSAILLQE